MHNTIEIDDIGDLPQVATKLLELSQSHKIFLLKGELGTGKTSLVKAFMSLSNEETSVSSPTFSLINIYGKNPEIYHLDLYRLDNTEEALAIGIEEILANEAIKFIEWPEIIEGLLPSTRVTVHISANGETQRKFEISVN